MESLFPFFDVLPDFSPNAEPCTVSIVFSELLAVQDVNLNLFEDPMEKMRLAYLLDELSESTMSRQ